MSTPIRACVEPDGSRVGWSCALTYRRLPARGALCIGAVANGVAARQTPIATCVPMRVCATSAASFKVDAGSVALMDWIARYLLILAGDAASAAPVPATIGGLR